MKLVITQPQLAELISKEPEIQIEIQKAARQMMGNNCLERKIEKAIQNASDLPRIVNNAIRKTGWHERGLKAEAKSIIKSDVNRAMGLAVTEIMDKEANEDIIEHLSIKIQNRLAPVLENAFKKYLDKHADAAVEKSIRKRLGV